jgi:hypothetical protein
MIQRGLIYVDGGFFRWMTAFSITHAHMCNGPESRLAFATV